MLEMGCEMSKSYARNGLSFISKILPETLKGKKFFYTSMLSCPVSHCSVNCPMIPLWGNRNLPIYQHFYALTVLLSCKMKLNPFYIQYTNKNISNNIRNHRTVGQQPPFPCKKSPFMGENRTVLSTVP